jgi:uncharacterized membrane protein
VTPALRPARALGVALRALFVAALCLSPVLLHLAIVRESRALLVAFFALVGCGVAASAARRQAPPWIAAGAVALVPVAATIDFGTVSRLALAAPALGMLALAWVFGRTLGPGRTPLIERFSRIVDRDGPPPWIAGYARRVTWAWTVLMAAIPLVWGTLMLFGTPAAASFFLNFVSWGLMGALYFGEYLYRVARYPDFPHRNPLAVARDLARSGPELFRA